MSLDRVCAWCMAAVTACLIAVTLVATVGEAKAEGRDDGGSFIGCSWCTPPSCGSDSIFCACGHFWFCTNCKTYHGCKCTVFGSGC
jgi:hypothetical protein